MKSPSQQKIIQIDITNACMHKCSNCTRHCAHHKKPYMMSFDNFTKAVESLSGFDGMVGVMGGEPTLHPEFEKFARHFKQARPEVDEDKRRWLTEPLSDADFCLYRNLHLSNTNKRRGLWSSLGKRYFDHFKVIQEVFPFQCLNDHKHDGEHQALLVARKDLGISDEEFVQRRDNCWLQNKWSASITPKGAFFCEVAGALDMLFNGPGGWSLDSDWWQRGPEDFKDQLHWCEMCSACLRVPMRKASDELDTVSDSVYEELKKVSNNLKRCRMIDTVEYKPEEHPDLNAADTYEPYLKDGDNSTRIGGSGAPSRFQLFLQQVWRELDKLPSFSFYGAGKFLHTLYAVKPPESGKNVSAIYDDNPKTETLYGVNVFQAYRMPAFPFLPMPPVFCASDCYEAQMKAKVRSKGRSAIGISNFFHLAGFDNISYGMMPRELSENNRPKKFGKNKLAKLNGVVVCSGYSDMLSWTLPINKKYFDWLEVVTSKDDTQTQAVCIREGVSWYAAEKELIQLNGASFNKGALINKGLDIIAQDMNDKCDMALLFDADIILPDDLRDKLDTYSYDPNVIYFAGRFNIPEVNREEWLKTYSETRQGLNKCSFLHSDPFGYFQLFSPLATQFKGQWPNVYSEAFHNAGGCDFEFARKFDDKKQALDVAVLHIPPWPSCIELGRENKRATEGVGGPYETERR